jgi:tetratricopeptide (TPR) repeat protein
MNFKNINKSNYKVITRFHSLALYSLIFTCFSLSGCSATKEAPDFSATPNTAQTTQAIARADELFQHREDIKNVGDGVAVLKQLRQTDYKNFEAAWKMSRLCMYLARYTDDKKEAEAASKDGIDSARAAIKLEENKPDGYFWLAANLGESARKNPLSAMSSLAEIRSSMEKVIALQPDYEGGTAFDVLAQIELQTNIIGGNANKAIEHLEKALTLVKDNTYLHVHLGAAYLAVDRKADAKRELETAVNMTPPAGHEFEHKEAVEEAQKLLSSKL